VIVKQIEIKKRDWEREGGVDSPEDYFPQKISSRGKGLETQILLWGGKIGLDGRHRPGEERETAGGVK